MAIFASIYEYVCRLILEIKVENNIRMKYFIYFFACSLGYRHFMLAIQSQVLVLNKMLSSTCANSSGQAGNCALTTSNTGNTSAMLPSMVTVSGNKTMTSLVTKPAASQLVSSVPVSAESLASPPERPTLGRLRLVSTPSSSSVSPIGSSLDSLEEEPVQAIHESEQAQYAEGEAVESSGCIVS
jgi:hypothetical protein